MHEPAERTHRATAFLIALALTLILATLFKELLI